MVARRSSGGLIGGQPRNVQTLKLISSRRPSRRCHRAAHSRFAACSSEQSGEHGPPPPPPMHLDFRTIPLPHFECFSIPWSQ